MAARKSAASFGLEDLRKELKKGEVRPAYLVAGEEPLLRDECLAAIEDVVLATGPRDFNYDRYGGGQIDAASLGDALRALPVMSERRLVVLRDPEARKSAATTALLDALPDLLKTLISDAERDGGPSTVFVIVAEKADRRARWTKAFTDPAARIECDPPKDARSLAKFLAGEARAQQIELEPDAAELLVERIGPQLLLLRNELAKTALVAGPGQAVTREHVAKSTSMLADEPVWDLTDAIGEGRTADALALLGRMLGGGAAAPMVLGALASHFRKLAAARGGKLSGPPFIQRKLEQQARRYSPARLLASLRAIHQADLELKGLGVQKPEMALEQLVLGLAS